MLRDIPHGARARLSPRWGLACGFVSVGEGLALPVVSWLLAGCPQASSRQRASVLQTKGRGGRGRVKMRGEAYLIYKECSAGIGGGLASRAIQVGWGTASPAVGHFPSVLASGRLLQMLLRAAHLLPTRLEARRCTPPFD